MGPSEEVQTFERMTLKGKRYFFRLVDAGNNEIIAQSQPYKTKEQRQKTALRLSYAFGCAVTPGRRK